MTRYRIMVNRWDHHSNITLHNGSLRKAFPLYLPSHDATDALAVRKLSIAKGLEKGIEDLPKLALIAGTYSTVWIGQLEGKLIPMDVPPEGWTYANEEPAEPSWFWQWKPSEESEKQLLNELADTNPLREASGILKTLIPNNKARNYGAIQSVEAIDLVRLIGMVKSDIPWLFEFDFDAAAKR